MKGFPKHFNSKKDVLVALEKWPKQTKGYLETLLNNTQIWLLDKKLGESEQGIEDEMHKVTEIREKNTGEITERYQMVFTEDPNCKLYRLGFSKQEASSITDKQY